ncbi:MAG: exopolyphosphatase [Rhodospirillales bacterium RIFCSPLOWO2_12_FULL_58_28]|nr:MAG: exopolyphosphatase [Rhodospirillales bacterium RIFCSPLOWO2_02_FULL_58_16]OHC78428.1 MAG: exopolyphosphatase [Rhodospirillales bacterium RIFCSPLOWO2_12_FULL_58_28]
MEDRKFRLITRSDFDGLVSAILLKEIDLIEDIFFVHPKDMQDGTVPVTDGDILSNLPYNKNAHLVFDHHLSEAMRVRDKPENYIIDPTSPSAARVIYNYYGGKNSFPHIEFFDIMEAVDKCDAARFSPEEIIHPNAWVLLGFLMDARTGLGRFKEFSISNYDLMINLIDYCRDHTGDEVLKQPHVKERVDLYMEHQEKFKEQIRRCITVHGNLGVLDLRKEEIIYAGNRFMIYAMYPNINISIHAMRGRNDQNTVFAVGKSIIDRSSITNVGALMLKYGGGGHQAAGTCQIDNDRADEVLKKLIAGITADG